MMTIKGVLWSLALFAVTVMSVEANSKQVCSGNPTNSIRTGDCEGRGEWGAPRGPSKHKGIDIICSSGSTIYAPMSGTVSKGWPYGNPKRNQRCINIGIKVTSGATVLGIFYASPYEHVLGEYVTAGTAIGTHISVHCAYRTCMTDHVHFAKFVNGNKEDPTAEYGNL